MTVEQSPPAPNLPPPTAKTPGIVVTALVMSIVGITGVTAVIGIILGFIGRSKAKQVGKGSGMALAAIIIGAVWLVIIAFGALLGDSDSTETTAPEQEAVEEVVDEPAEEPMAEETAEDAAVDLTVGSLGVTIEELPAKWNEAVQAYGAGFILPDQIAGEPNSVFPSLDGAFLQFELTDGSPGTGSVSIDWVRETGEVGSITIDGLVDNEQIATALAASAGAAIYSTTDLSIAEAETFFVDELVGDSLDNVIGAPEIGEIIEEDDRTYRFTLFSNSMSFEVFAPLE